MKDVLVSIITPTYNSSLFVRETIESIIAQTYSNWELLITDDCSTDSTWKVLNEYAQKDNRIKIFRLNKNSGAGIARNNSIFHALGRFIAFCDSDDLWKPEKLELQIAFMIEHQIVLSYTNCYIIDENGNITGMRILPLKVNYNDMLLNNYIITLTSVYDAQMLGKMYMEDVRNRQDWLLWLSILKKSSYAICLCQTLGYYREQNNSISKNKIKMMKYNWLVYYKYEKFSFFKSLFYIIRYLFMYVKKVK